MQRLPVDSIQILLSRKRKLQTIGYLQRCVLQQLGHQRGSQKDVPVQDVQIYNCSCAERRKEEDSNSYEGCKLFLSKDWFEVVGINCGIASILLFRINILLFSESIWFCAKMTRTEPDDKVEIREVLGPLCLPLGQHLGSREILKIFMICNNIDRINQNLQVVLPNFESFKNSKQFLVMYIIVQLCCSKNIGVKSNQMNFIFFINNGKDCSKSIVQSISFHNKLSIGNPISKNRSGDEYLLERVESIMTEGVKLPENILLGEVCQWNNNI